MVNCLQMGAIVNFGSLLILPSPKLKTYANYLSNRFCFPLRERK